METIPDNAITAGIFRGKLWRMLLGLPVQFEESEERDIKPFTEMIGYGVFNASSL